MARNPTAWRVPVRLGPSAAAARRLCAGCVRYAMLCSMIGKWSTTVGSPVRGTVRAGDVRADRPLLPDLPDRPGLGPQPRVRHRGRLLAAQRAYFRRWGVVPAELFERHARAPPLTPAHRAVRPRQLAAPARQHALPLRLRGDGRGTHGPGRVRPLLPRLRLSRAARLRGGQRRLAADPGRRLRGDLRRSSARSSTCSRGPG